MDFKNFDTTTVHELAFRLPNVISPPDFSQKYAGNYDYPQGVGLVNNCVSHCVILRRHSMSLSRASSSAAI
jgi:hypothetical protein